jgi:hypothetical protein
MGAGRRWIEQAGQQVTQDRLVVVVRHLHEDVAAIFLDPVMT